MRLDCFGAIDEAVLAGHRSPALSLTGLPQLQDAFLQIDGIFIWPSHAFSSAWRLEGAALPAIMHVPRFFANVPRSYADGKPALFNRRQSA